MIVGTQAQVTVNPGRDSTSLTDKLKPAESPRPPPPPRAACPPPWLRWGMASPLSSSSHANADSCALSQLDTDGDLAGDACDSDLDG